MADIIGLAIEPHNDLRLGADGGPVLVEDGEAIGQHIRQRLMSWLNEWFLDKSAGVDWTRYVLGRPPQEMQIAEAVIKAEIAATPGVTEIVEFDASYDRRSRGLRIHRCEVVTEFDDLIEIQF